MNEARTHWHSHLLMLVTASGLALLLAVPAVAEIENSKIGFSSNHLFEGAIKGENVDILNGNVNLQIPIGPRYMLNDWFGYQLTLYYNSKIWWSECDPAVPHPDSCEAGLVSDDPHGVGFLLSFGRIYRHPDDNAHIWRYQTPDGADHFFCHDAMYPTDPTPCAVDRVTLDPGAVHLTWDASNQAWQAKPGDGTLIRFGYSLGAYDPETNTNGGYYATRIETIAQDPGGEAQQWVNIAHDLEQSSAITRITDKAERTIDFDYQTDTTISMPAFGGATANYVLRKLTLQPIQDPLGNQHFVTLLDELELPEGYKYTFNYNVPGVLSSWQLPTGATLDYRYSHYRSSEYKPYHSQVVAKELTIAGQPTYTWTYTRFGDGTPETAEEAEAMADGEAFVGTNPPKVKVLDPFRNLSVYHFHWTVLHDPFGNDYCNPNGCRSTWSDGLAYSIQTFAGPEDDFSRLVSLTQNSYTYDGYYQYKYSPGFEDNRSGVNTRLVDSTVTTYGAGDYPTTTRRTVHSDWTHEDPDLSTPVARSRKTEVYGVNGLYRSSYTDYDPDLNFHDRHTYSEIRDDAGQVVSRTDTEWDINRLVCSRRRNTALGDDQTDCSSPLQTGDVRVVTTYDAEGNPANRTWSTIPPTTGTEQSSITHYHYTDGVLDRQSYGGFGWDAVDRDIDANTGLVIRSRDPLNPSSWITEYDWDLLGRLKNINPALPEVPTDIVYPSIHETVVTQSPDDFNGNGGITQSRYIYDELGRLVEEHRRAISGAQVTRYTEYDISGRVTRQSEWSEVFPATAWTDYRYDSPFEDPDNPGTYFVDPLGRVSKVTRPDDGTTEMAYEGLATHVTINGVQGESGTFSATTAYVNDEFGRLTQVDSPGMTADAVYAYDQRDQLVEVRLLDPDPPPEGPAVQSRHFTYDALGRLHTATNPENGTIEYEAYSERGKLLQHRDAEGNVFKNSYDQAGRPRNKSLDGEPPRLLSSRFYTGDRLGGHDAYDDGGDLVASTTFHYEWAGGGAAASCHQATGESGTVGTVAYLNGRLGQVKTTLHPWGQQLTTTYCQYSDGKLAYMSYPNAGNDKTLLRLKYYNGYLTEVEDFYRPIDYVSSITYSPHGAPTGFLRHSGLEDRIPRDSQGRPQSFSVHDGGPAIWDTGAYAYDDAGNVAGIGLNNYFYDEVNRLTAALVYSTDGPQSYDLLYAYDAFGNMVIRDEQLVGGSSTLTSFDVDRGTNRLVSRATGATVAPFAFDPRGNMTMNGDFGYVFDVSNRMTEVWNASDETNLVAQYAYDANGNRVRTVSDETETYYVRDQAGQVLAEFRRPTGATYAPVWNKDHIYALGQSVTMLKNSDPQAPGRPWAEDAACTEIELSWHLVEDPDVTGYSVSRTVTVPGQDPVQDSFSVSAPPLIDPVDPEHAHPSVTFEYSIHATDSAQNSSAESPVLRLEPCDTSQPPSPEHLQGVALDGAVTLSWDPVVAQDLWGYIVEHSSVNPFPTAPSLPKAGSGVPNPDPYQELNVGSPGEQSHLPTPVQQGWVILNDSPLTPTSYHHFGLENGETYYYRVYAVDTSGIMSRPSGAVRMTPRDVTAPARPVNVTARPGIAAGEILVMWDHVVDGDLASYLVTEGQNQYVVSKDDNHLLDSQLISAASYTYTVQAVDTSGNESSGSDPVTGTTRDSAIDVPDVTSVEFFVDDGGTPGTWCTTWSEGDDVIGVKVEWTALTSGPDRYRIYRAKDQGHDYVPIADVQEDDPGLCDAGVCSYFDAGLGYPEYTYHVVAVDGPNESGADGAHTATDQYDPNIRTIRVWDGRYWGYETDNRRIRQVAVTWSRLMETEVFGYHVYRRCSWHCRPGSVPADQQLRDLSCTHSWSRLTDYPVTGNNFWIDTTLGELKGCFTYGVRAVGPDGQEGPLSQTVFADFNVGGQTGYPLPPNTPVSFCDEATGEKDIFSKYPIAWDYGRINNATKGSASAVGAPQAPTIVDRNQDACRSECYVGDVYMPNPPDLIFWESGQCDTCNNPLGDQYNVRTDKLWEDDPEGNPQLTGPSKGLYAYIDWEPNQESDLAGYHVEMAGSTEGPWVRLTPDPIAWWETHYDARLWVLDWPDTDPGIFPEVLWLGPDCAVFQVIAVDEAGNESPPSDRFQVAPFPERSNFDWNPLVVEQPCSAATPTLEAPHGLAAESEGGATKLTWDRVPGADAYRVYRLVIKWNDAHRFYATAVIHESGTCWDDFTACSVENEAVDCDGIGPNEECNVTCSGPTCEFVEEGDLNSATCPYDASGDHCSLGLLDAFYVTAIEYAENPGEMPRESPRSNIVLWDSNSPNVWNLSDEEVFDALAQNAPSDEDLWCEGSGTVLSCEGGPIEMQLAHVDSDGPSTAPLLTLGQTEPCPGCDVYDLHVDHLGSTRVVTDTNGTIVSVHDFMPFGKEITPIFDYSTKMFTGHERDKETGLDYMLARYYGSNLPRFLSPDPGDDSDLTIPQTLNKYTYVRNNPLIGIDPFGEDTYLVNRQLGGDEARSRSNPLTHTFIVTTDSQGNVEHTYSWGNDPDPKNENVEGRWFKDESEDIKAAKEALRDGKAEKVGEETLDAHVENAFNAHADNEKDPSNHRNGIVCRNCKTEAGKLIDEAKEKEKKAKGNTTSGGNKGPNSYGIDPDGPYGPAPNPCAGRLVC